MATADSSIEIIDASLEPNLPDLTTSTPSTAASTPSTAESTPSTAESTPNTAKSTPITTASTPSTAASTPSTTESTPSTAESTPITAESTPNTAESTPNTAESTPITAESTPITAESTPNTAESTPNTAESTPNTTESTPSTAESTPITAESTPSTAESTPNTAESTPSTAESTPNTAESTPSTAESTPSTAESTPNTAESTPITTASVPTTARVSEPVPLPRNKTPTPLLSTTGERRYKMDMDGLYETPWRKTVNWNNMFQTLAELKDEIESFEPLGDLLTDEVQFPRVNILLFGGVGAGKSSVFNSINSVFRGKIFNVARSGCTEHSLTTKFTRYPVMSGSSTLPMPMKFRICDIRGLEQEHLMTKENMRYILEGNIADRFPFDPSGSISADMPGFTKHPDLHERIHCVALVQDASIVDAMQDLSPEVTKNVKDMQTVMNSLDIPQVVILTKIDSICEETKHETANTFRSPKVEKCVAKVSEVLGLPRNSIFPMKNYEMEYQLDPSIDILALLTLKGILNNCDAHLFNHYDEIVKNYRVSERRNSFTDYT